MALLHHYIKIAAGHIRLFWVFCLVVQAIWPGMLAAAPNHKVPVVILNSDQSVKKYETLQMEFKQAFPLSTVDIDLGTTRNDTQVIRNVLSETLPELIVCIGGKAYLTAHRLAPETPKIFCLGINWQRYPVSDQTYVISNEIALTAQLTLYRFFFPNIRRIGVIYNAEINKKWFVSAAKEAKALGITLVGGAVADNDDIHTVQTTDLANTDALWLIADGMVLNGKAQVMEIFQTAQVMKKPIFTYHPVFASLGASFIISADIRTMARQAAQTALKVCNRREIVQQIQEPAGTRIAINVDKIDAWGIRLNQRALSQVNDFIELPAAADSEGRHE